MQTTLFSLLTATVILAMTMKALASPSDNEPISVEAMEARIAKHSQQIKAEPQNAQHYIVRGNDYFLASEFDKAVEDYTTALKLDDALDRAYYGRGLAQARAGRIKEGIADLSVYITRNPDDSRAYTKRGIRYMWLDEQENARKDLEMAIKLDPANAEAHDDLGVIYASRGENAKAADHFLTTLELDPTYQKAYHNMAMISYLTKQDELALGFIESALRLLPESRDSLLLKSKILEEMGQSEEAEALREEAEFLPEGNWSKHIPLR